MNLAEYLAFSLKTLAERLGLDWIGVLFRAIARRGWYEPPIPPYPYEAAEIDKRLGQLTHQRIEYALAYCTTLHERALSRSEKIESKAVLLLGTTGITSAFVVGFASFLLSSGKDFPTGFLVAGAVCYFALILALVMTILLASRVVAVEKYTYPGAQRVFRFSSSSVTETKRQHVIDLFESFAKNVHVANTKATYLIGAQKWFVNAIVILLFIALLIAIYIPLCPNAETVAC